MKHAISAYAVRATQRIVGDQTFGLLICFWLDTIINLHVDPPFTSEYILAPLLFVGMKAALICVVGNLMPKCIGYGSSNQMLTVWSASSAIWAMFILIPFLKFNSGSFDTPYFLVRQIISAEVFPAFAVTSLFYAIVGLFFYGIVIKFAERTQTALMPKVSTSWIFSLTVYSVLNGLHAWAIRI
jgi:hypothetical protein